MNHKDIAKLFIDAEIRSNGRLDTASMIHLNHWVTDVNREMRFFTPEQLKGLKHSALFIECYTAMLAELTS